MRPQRTVGSPTVPLTEQILKPPLQCVGSGYTDTAYSDIKAYIDAFAIPEIHKHSMSISPGPIEPVSMFLNMVWPTDPCIERTKAEFSFDNPDMDIPAPESQTLPLPPQVQHLHNTARDVWLGGAKCITDLRSGTPRRSPLWTLTV